MGNLARATFDGTTTSVWPWSYNRCDKEQVPYINTKQKINACNKNPPSGFNPQQGRGAPEIDIFEVMPGHEMPGHTETIRPFMSTSLQISPGITAKNRPINGQELNDTRLW
jgi:hypothetical protein